MIALMADRLSEQIPIFLVARPVSNAQVLTILTLYLTLIQLTKTNSFQTQCHGNTKLNVMWYPYLNVLLDYSQELQLL